MSYFSVHKKMRLRDKVSSSWHRIGNHRAARERIWKAYIGDTYGLSQVNDERVPLNGHALYVRSLLLHLAAHQPKLLLNTNIGPWKPLMEMLAFQASNAMRRERFGSKQQRWVLDAMLYSPGILKVALEWRRKAQEEGYIEVLETTVSNVDPSDIVWDTAGNNWHDCDFVGHKVRLPVEDVLDNPVFADVSEETLRGLSGSQINDEERLFFEDDDGSQPYRDTVTLWEIYDRCENRLKIWPVDATNLTLYDEPWTGHPNGPLHTLDFLDVPNHVVGLSPLCILHNLIEAMNRSLSKAIKQTDAAKDIFMITDGNKAEAEAVMQSLDGQGVYKHGGGLAEMMSVGGPNARTLAMVPVLKDLFNWLGGNINELAGLGVSAPTATQGQLLHEAASGMVNFMQARTQEAVRLACEAIVYNVAGDTVSTEMVPYSLADGQTHWEKFTPEMRNSIDTMLVNTQIDVFSMRYRSPEQRLAQLNQWWTQMAVPSYPLWQQDGGRYDVQALFRTYADYADLPEINDIALYSVEPRPQATGQSEPLQPRQSPVTTRTNVRMDGKSGEQSLGGDLARNLSQMEAA